MVVYLTNRETLQRIFSEDHNKQCAWCKRWFVNGVWTKDPPSDSNKAVTHGLCGDCAANLRRETEDYKKNRQR